MLFSAAALSTILLLASQPLLAAANGQDQQPCSPDVGSAAISIIAGQTEWRTSVATDGQALLAYTNAPVSSFLILLNASAEWQLKQVGSSPPSYSIKPVNNPNVEVVAMNVAPFPNGELHLKDLNYYQGEQSWEISCSKCFAGAASAPGGAQIASGCTIKLRPTSTLSDNWCVKYQGDGSLRVGACAGGQTFDLWSELHSTSKSSCNPTLAGLEVSIISTSSGSLQWGVSQDVAGTALGHALGQVPLNSSAEWRVMQVGGSSQPTYVLGDINKDSLVVDAPSVAGGAAPTLELSPIDSSSETQRWEIDCQQCFPDVASNPSPGGGRLAAGCTIKRVSSDLCAELMSGVSAPIGATSCSGSSLQTFDFWLPTFNIGMGRPDSPSSTPSHSSSSSKPSSSSPSSSGGTCAPDVGGLGVSIIAGSKEWGVSSAVSGTALRSDLGKLPLDKTAEWRVKQLGSAQGPYPPTYIFEEIGHTDLVVNALSVGGRGMPVLTLSPFDTSSETQIWAVECHECESNKVLIEGGGMMGKGCTIKLVGGGLCAQIESGTTASIGVASCSKAAAQTFDFYHAIPAASVPSGPQPSSPGSSSSPSCSSGPSCASSCPHVASGNLLSGALASDNSAGFNYAPVIIGILATNLLILLVLLCLGVMNFIRNGKKAGLTRNYVPVKMKDTDAFLAPPFEDDKRYSDS